MTDKKDVQPTHIEVHAAIKPLMDKYKIGALIVCIGMQDNDGGVFTYDRLVDATPEHIRKKLYVEILNASIKEVIDKDMERAVFIDIPN